MLTISKLFITCHLLHENEYFISGEIEFSFQQNRHKISRKNLGSLQYRYNLRRPCDVRRPEPGGMTRPQKGKATSRRTWTFESAKTLRSRRTRTRAQRPRVTSPPVLWQKTSALMTKATLKAKRPFYLCRFLFPVLCLSVSNLFANFILSIPLFTLLCLTFCPLSTTLFSHLTHSSSVFC